MTLRKRLCRSGLISALAASAAVALASCSSSDAPSEASDEPSVAQEAPADEAVQIPEDTAVGQETQRIVEILNADADTTAEEWEDALHSSFTAEVPVEELVELLNQNVRPAQPFTVTGYEGGDRQAVTTLTSPVSAPVDMTLSLDADGMITGLFFGETTSDG
ncbi:hypothetical protein GCM10009720_19030 [Yaniella flava]|uniref:ORF 12 gene product N-terminal domain-containing protein n=1 Tax=Yaniella flava TaxID=287930 RepID=A0ABP5G2E5_9MICC|nr:hypothetical protein [Micrococcaceae bacterium]